MEDQRIARLRQRLFKVYADVHGDEQTQGFLGLDYAELVQEQIDILENGKNESLSDLDQINSISLQLSEIESEAQDLDSDTEVPSDPVNS